MTVTVKSRTPLTVPDQVRRRAGLKPGDKVEFKVSGRVVTILPAPSEDDDILSPEQAKRLRQSIKQMRQGKAKPWAKIKNELGL